MGRALPILETSQPVTLHSRCIPCPLPVYLNAQRCPSPPNTESDTDLFVVSAARSRGQHLAPHPSPGCVEAGICLSRFVLQPSSEHTQLLSALGVGSAPLTPGPGASPQPSAAPAHQGRPQELIGRPRTQPYVCSFPSAEVSSWEAAAGPGKKIKKESFRMSVSSSSPLPPLLPSGQGAIFLSPHTLWE